ncbi:universal stress protein [Mucilaginibacter sp. UR6-11]|uniref:universal stress protein n=1 Tax=Mucilaginibacter sp. UR6-11 TaxID=1435644 RepID=UPI001E55BD91|nr:universal stress protein [Mucilaginibacter sp. UR6-11]MCC8426396.1 universal stress protein [Mucilaginibacter sp. UR6-11]
MAIIKEKETKMKKLLVLTDFTANASHAAASARQLCTKMNTDLLLYHSVQYVPIVPEFTNGGMVAETNESLFKDSGLQLEQVAGSLQTLALPGEGYRPQIICENGEGSLAANIKELTARQDIRLVIMGGRSGGALDHLLSGSETSAVINASRKPVLIIPASADISVLKKVVFATDFQAADLVALNFLTDLGQSLDVQVEVVHVTKPESVITNIEPEILFRKQLNQLDAKAVSYKQVMGDDIGSLLQQQCQENGPALLAMTHQRHGMLSQLFGHSESKKMLKKGDVAVLIFPPDLDLL